MKIAMASDHGGFDLKEQIKAHLEEKGYEILDLGTDSAESVDYPVYGRTCGEAVACGRAQQGIVCCGTGIGISIAANKVKGIRCAVATNPYMAEMAKQHNNANILALGGRVLTEEEAKDIVDTWLATEFEGGRHQRRVGMLEENGGEKMGNVYVFDHPLIQHKLALLRDKDTSTKDFRELVKEISMLMAYEATRNLPLDEVEVETPICKAKMKMLAGESLAIIPILRAGLGMVDGILSLVPNAKVGHIGMFRDPETKLPVEYYCKLPEGLDRRELFVVDPMLATGGSASAAITLLKQKGAKRITLMCLIAAPEGIAVITKDHPDVDVFVAAKDDHLNEHAYIVPGLGDAGDRLYGTK